MKSSHKTDTHFSFIIQQLTFNFPFKCDCAGRKKKHGFSTFQKWQIWPNFTVVKTQLGHGRRTTYWSISFVVVCVKIFLAAFQTRPVDRPKSEGYFDTRKERATSKFRRFECYRGTQREYPHKHSIVKRILVFKR